MKRITGTMLGCLAGIAVVFWLFVELCSHDNKQTARQYREEYREQGRRQVRAEAIRAGAAIEVDGKFIWKTEEIALLQQEIHDLVLTELRKRRQEDASSKKESNEESSPEGKEEGSSSGKQEQGTCEGEESEISEEEGSASQGQGS